MNLKFDHKRYIKDQSYHTVCPILHTEGRLLFKYHEYSTKMKPSEQLTYSRTMPYHVLVFQLSGQAYLSWGEYKDVEIKAGEMYFLPRGAEVSGYIVGDVSYVIAEIARGMSNKELDDLRKMKNYEKFTEYEFKPMAMHPPMLRLAESVREYLVNGVNCVHMHEAKFSELYVILHWYYSIADNAQLFYHMAGSISEFKNFILDNYKVGTLIEDLVERSNMSRSTFDRKFKEAFNTTPLKWIEEHTRQLIISKASEPNITVKDIMYELNIYNSSQFTNLCKRLCGMTPSKLIRLK